MADTDIHAKLDRLLAGQAVQAQGLADMETALGAVVQGVHGLVPLLSTHTEMLQLILVASSGEPAGDTDLANLLANLVASMERVEAMLGVMSGELRRTVETPAMGQGGSGPESN